MSKNSQTPQEKKQNSLERDHFTFAEYPHRFRNHWKQKKAKVNRQFRRKSNELLAPNKPGLSLTEAESLVGDVTAKQLRESVTRKRLQKSGTVPLTERIQIKLKKRKETVGRRVDHKSKYDELVASAIKTLVSLEGDELTDTITRIALLLRGGDSVEWMRLYGSRNRLDQAVFFVNELARGNAYYVDALRRDQKLCEFFQLWKKNANRILTKLQRLAQRKLQEKATNEKRAKARRRQVKKA